MISLNFFLDKRRKEDGSYYEGIWEIGEARGKKELGIESNGEEKYRYS